MGKSKIEDHTIPVAQLRYTVSGKEVRVWACSAEGQCLFRLKSMGGKITKSHSSDRVTAKNLVGMGSQMVQPMDIFIQNISNVAIKEAMSVIAGAYSIDSLRHWKKQYKDKSEDQIPLGVKEYIEALRVYDFLSEIAEGLK